MTRRPTILLVLLCATSAAVAAPAGRSRKATKHRESATAARLTSPADATTSNAYRYGQLSQDACEAELATRNIAFVREAARGVRAPVRLTGPLHGVVFRTDAQDAARATSPYEIGDCRLVLALDDFAEILASHEIVEVRHYSMWRPPPPSWPEAKEATRHAGAVALDAGRFEKKDGSVLDVDKHFHGRIGAKTCGDGAGPRPVTPEATELRAILCETVAKHLFNVVLTPNYNRPHKNHFHLEVTEGAKWFLLR